jgi:uncharacterized membrane protein YbaN (DUF454 family)
MAARFADAVRDAVAAGSFAAERRGQSWTALTVFAAEGTASSWETIREGRGDLRLRNPILHKDMNLAQRVARELSEASGVMSSRATLWARDLEIRFDPDATSAVTLARAAEDAFERALRPELDRVTVEEPGLPAVVKGPKRLGYMLLAGGSFSLTVVGLVVPGVPTVPFLLATSYYLARSSPTLNGMLLRSRFFGPILDDLERWGGLRRINKIKLVALTLAVGGVTLVLIGPPLAVIVVMFGVASAGVYVVAKMPGVPSQSQRPALSDPQPTLA